MKSWTTLVSESSCNVRNFISIHYFSFLFTLEWYIMCSDIKLKHQNCEFCNYVTLFCYMLLHFVLTFLLIFLWKLKVHFLLCCSCFTSWTCDGMNLCAFYTNTYVPINSVTIILIFTFPLSLTTFFVVLWNFAWLDLKFLYVNILHLYSGWAEWSLYWKVQFFHI